MRDFYEPVYSSYPTHPFQTQPDHGKKSGSSGGNVLGRFLKLGKSKSDAHGHGLKSRSSRPASYHSDDFEEDFRLTPSSKSPVERMVHKVNSRKDISRSHSWIYGSVKLPNEFGYTNGDRSGYSTVASGPVNSLNMPPQQHGMARYQKMDYCGACDCTNDFDFLSPGPSSPNNFPSPMNLDNGCPGCNPTFAMNECGKNARQYFDGGMTVSSGRRKSSQGIVDSSKKFGSSVRKLTWKSLKQAVRKRPSLDNVLKKSSLPQQQLPSPPSAMMYNGSGSKEMPSCSHEDLLASNYFFPEKQKNFYASCTDLYGESPPYVASVRVRPRRARQPWPLNEFGPVPNYQEEEIYHSEWDLRQFMPYDVWLTATNNPLLNQSHSQQTPPSNSMNGNGTSTRIPKINRPSNLLTSASASTSTTPTASSSSSSSINNSNYGNNKSNSSQNMENKSSSNGMKNSQKAMGSSSTIYGQTIVKRSSILRTDVTAYQLIKSTRGGGSSHSTCSRNNNDNDDQSDSDDLSDNVLTEDPVRIGGQGIYMISSNPVNGTNPNPNNQSNSSTMSHLTEPNRTSTFTGVPSKINKKAVDETRQTSSSLGSSKEMKIGGGSSSVIGIRDRDQVPDKTNNNRLIDLHDQGSTPSSSTFNPINNSLKTYCSQPPINNVASASGLHYAQSNVTGTGTGSVTNSNMAPSKKQLNGNVNNGGRLMSDRSGTKHGENGHNTTNENNQDYLCQFDTYEYQDFDQLVNDSNVTDTKLRHEAQDNKNHENSLMNDNKYFSNNKQGGNSSNNYTNGGEMTSTNSPQDNANGSKYGALKRRKGRNNNPGGSKTLLKETIYEEESDESESRRLTNNQDIYAVKIVVSQNSSSEYVKPILKKERVYETPCLDGKNHQMSPTLHNENNYYGNNPSNGSDVCGDGVYGSATRSTKKVQFDNSLDKLVVCGGLSEEDDGNESDDTLVRVEKDDSDWIVEDEDEHTRQTQSKANLPSSNEFLMEDDSMKSCTKMNFTTETKNTLAHHPSIQTPRGGVGVGVGVNNPDSYKSKPKHANSVDSKSTSGGGGSRSEKCTGDKEGLKENIPHKIHDHKNKTSPQDQMNQSLGGMSKIEQAIQDKIKIHPRKYETPHASSSSPLKADRIVNMPERKTVKGSGGEQQIINPNSLLFHDTTRIRLNQSRPSIEHTFKLNLSQPGEGSRVENGGNRGNNRIKQSSSFRTPVPSGTLPNSKFQMRPREPPPPPPPSSQLSSKTLPYSESSSNKLNPSITRKSSESLKLQKTSNPTKIDRRQSMEEPKLTRVVEGQCSRGNKSEISSQSQSPIQTGGGGTRNGVNMKNMDSPLGTLNSTMNGSNNNNNNKNAHGKSTTVPTKNSPLNSNSHRQVKVSSNRSKSLAERCKAVEKVLAQHSQQHPNSNQNPTSQPTIATILPQTHEEKQTKSHNLIKTINGGGGDRLASNKVLENNKISLDNKKMNGTTKRDGDVGDGNEISNCHHSKESKATNNNKKDSFLLSQQNNSNLHHKSNSPPVNTPQQQSIPKNESYANQINNGSLNNHNNNLFQSSHNDENKTNEELLYDGTQNIEIVTKENSVSEIRIYSGTNSLNIDHNSEAAKILNNYNGRPRENSNQEIHYAATDIVCPGTNKRNSSNSNSPEQINGYGHFRQMSAPSALISSRPQSTSVVLIKDYSVSKEEEGEGDGDDRLLSGSLNVETTKTREGTTTVRNPTSLMYDNQKQSPRSLQSSSSTTPSFVSTMTRMDQDTVQENEDKNCLDKTATGTGDSIEQENDLDNNSVMEEPLYDDVINHSTRQGVLTDERSGMKNFLSPLFQSLTKELTEKTVNSNKYPIVLPRPTSDLYPKRKNDQDSPGLVQSPPCLPPLLPPQNNNKKDVRDSNYPSVVSSPSVNLREEEILDNLYNDIEFNTVASIPPPPVKSEFGSINYTRNRRRGSLDTEGEQDDRIIYDDTLSVISSNYSRSLINGKIHEEEEEDEERGLNGDEPLYDDVLNLRSSIQDSDSGAETEDSPPPPLPQGPPPIHLLQRPCTDLPLISFPLLLTTTNNNNIINNNINNSMRKNSDQVIMGGEAVNGGDLLGDPKSFPLISMNDGLLLSSLDSSKKRQNNNEWNHINGSNNNLSGFHDNGSCGGGGSGSSNNSTLVEGDDVLDRTRTLLTELNDRLAKLNFGSPTDYSTYVSKVVISSSSESSGVEEDYNSEKNYSLSNGSFDENYRLTAVSKLVSETISMARGKFLDSMKLNNNHSNGGNHGVASPRSSSQNQLASQSNGRGVTSSSNELLEEPIYEEIGDLLNRSTSPIYADAFDAKSMFDGASKNEILNFLESIRDKLAAADTNSTDSAASSLNRSTKKIVEIERNDSGIGSESGSLVAVSNPKSLTSVGLRLCSDCSDAPVDTRNTVTTVNTTTFNGECTTGSGSGQITRALNLCRCCIRKRCERKELLLEIVETEKKYGRDLRIIEEEFYNPIQIAGLLTKEQLDQIFLNVGELIQVNQQLTCMLKSAIDTAITSQDDDLTTVNVGKIFMEFGETMMTTFDAYCTRQASAGALLTQLEKEKELLRIFLRVSQMENSTLRRMNLPAFLMVPVQRAVRYPLLLARLLKVTPVDHFTREELYSAQEKIEQHLEHMNKTTREVASVKLWRRISIMNGNIGNSSPIHRRSNSDLEHVKKMALDVLDWANFSDVNCVIESQLNVVHFNGKTLRNIYGCLLARGKDLESLALKMEQQNFFFPPAEDIVKDVKLVLVRVKNTRFCLLREPFCLSKAVISQGENEFQDFIEINEIITKNTYYFQGMEKHGTMEWLRLLQCYAVCVGQWRRRRGALANLFLV